MDRRYHWMPEEGHHETSATCIVCGETFDNAPGAYCSDACEHWAEPQTGATTMTEPTTQQPCTFHKDEPAIANAERWIGARPVPVCSACADRPGYVLSPLKAALATAALALCLLTTLPSDCAITAASGEGFPVATCDSGETWMQDLDGQVHPAAPYVEPGTWVRIN